MFSENDSKRSPINNFTTYELSFLDSTKPYGKLLVQLASLQQELFWKN